MSSLEEVKVESREAARGGVMAAVRNERWPEPQDYDVEFLKERDKDLNAALLIAGVLSVVISAFIIYIDPQFQPDPNEESAALLRVLLLKFDNTVFGGEVPQVPHWTGPSCTIIATQTLLYLSLAATLASASFTILAKKLLGLCALAGSRDSNIEQGWNSQRRLRCSPLSLRVVLLALSSMLRFALALFNCAVSVYVWEVNSVIAAITFVVTFCAISFYSPFGVLVR